MDQNHAAAISIDPGRAVRDADNGPVEHKPKVVILF